MASRAKQVFRFLVGRNRARQWEWRVQRALISTRRNKAEGIFDADWYLAAYPDVRALGADPVHHFIHRGAAENRKPGPAFDPAFYLEAYPDVVAAGMNPLLHYVGKGRAEGRAPNAERYEGPQPLSSRHAVVKNFTVNESAGRATGSEAAVLLVHASTGRLDPHVVPLIEAFDASGVAVLLVIAAGRAVNVQPTEIAAAAGIVVCDERAGSFAIWAQAITLAPEVWGSPILYLVDDSLLPQSNNAQVADLLARVRESSADVVALTASQVRDWRVAGDFLALRQAALASWPFQFMVRDSMTGHFASTGARWQATFTTQLLDAGLSIETLYASTVALEDMSGRGSALLVHPERFRDRLPHHQPRVAYFGPWNYESGLGEASREMLCALRRAGYPLNAYPIMQPFHVHAQIGPAVATTDFASVADVAIVHLNPDNWHLLTAQQREVIRTARRRIGYWVWETDRVPPAWDANLRSVDRVWAPTRYCAEVFTQAAGLSVDVVPHPIAVPAQGTEDRTAVLARFGVAAGRRVILFVFDGASYLVRKNPAALIRAFAASGLEARGWTLLLKTKNLHDRPVAGAELEALARATPGAVLVVASISADELAALLDAADIYASPHCSEGFGLTVAEAMARGKPVVATDFAGTRDFLDATCGYPVRADPWTLEEDHGHYLAGHSWARIDEGALGTELLRAADAVEAGAWSPGSALAMAARTCITGRLSHDNVAQTVRQAIAAALDGPAAPRFAVPPSQPQPPPAPRLPRIDVSRAQEFSSAKPVRGIVPVCLGPDMEPAGPLPGSDERAWYFIAPANAKLAPDAFAIAEAAIAARPDVSLFYADDVAPDAALLDRVRLKPDFDPTLLAVQDYIGVPVIARASLAKTVGGLDPDKGPAALYDFVWRMAENGGVARIPSVLIAHDGARAAVSPERRRAVVRALPRYADYVIEEAREGADRLTRRFEPDTMPPVTLVIPTRRSRLPGQEGSTYVERLLEGVARTDWPMDRLAVLVGDDIEDTPAWEALPWPFALRRIVTARPAGEPFNYAAKMNRLWREAGGEQVVLMNDDVLPHGPGWLKALQTFALDRSVGGVGALLFYESGAIQHAGIFPSLRIAVHAWIGMSADEPTYQDWAMCQRRWSMVTGAVFATRRSLLDRIGGFDERLTLEFNDIDLCLRMRALGHGIVYNPAARFTHVEKASRGSNPPPAAEAALFLSRWSDWLAKDPASHPGYAADRIDVVPTIDSDVWYAG
jgi:GT2 family glycosyltransferase/glycosyltransferase involved in cell wall biosynthesis